METESNWSLFSEENVHVFGDAFCVLIFVLPISIPFFVSFALWTYPVLVVMNLIILLTV